MKSIALILFFLTISVMVFSQDSLPESFEPVVLTESLESFNQVESLEQLSEGNEFIIDNTFQETNTSEAVENVQLFPENYLFTQRLLWGEKGLLRKFDKFELSLSQREKEMDIRSTMITIHQYMGYATLASMLISGVVGQQLHSGKTNLQGFHSGYSIVTNVLYFSTATFSLFAPPPMKDRDSLTKLNVHRYLAILHFSSMVATNILGGMIEKNPSLAPYHRATAITAFGSLLAASVVIKL